MQIQPSLIRRSGAELFGTYALVAAGCGAIVVNSMTGALGHVGVALAFGLVVMVMVASTGHLSGAHLNPAVTVAFALTRHFPWREVPAYISGQLIGALAGACTLLFLFGSTADLGATMPLADPMQTLILETLLTAALMFVITAVATDTRAVGELAALAIGATVAVNAMHFVAPVHVSDVVCCYTDVTRVGRTSITIHVETWVMRNMLSDREKVTEVDFTFVAVDEHGHPKPISPDTDTPKA